MKKQKSTEIAVGDNDENPAPLMNQSGVDGQRDFWLLQFHRHPFFIFIHIPPH